MQYFNRGRVGFQGVVTVSICHTPWRHPLMYVYIYIHSISVYNSRPFWATLCDGCQIDSLEKSSNPAINLFITRLLELLRLEQPSEIMLSFWISALVYLYIYIYDIYIYGTVSISVHMICIHTYMYQSCILTYIQISCIHITYKNKYYLDT